MSFIDKIGGRKFVFGILLTFCATAFVLMGMTTVKEWMTFEAVVGATYIMGNVSKALVDKL